MSSELEVFKPSMVTQEIMAAKDEAASSPSTAPNSVPASPELASSASSDSISSIASLESPLSPPIQQAVADSFVFAFDIDGVLVRGGKAIPEAIQAMKVLNGENEHGIQM